MGLPPEHSDIVSITETERYSIRVSEAIGDPAWDGFLEQTRGNAFTQTSCWGRARAFLGWKPVRVVVSEGGHLVAGAQMLIRALPIGGNVGFVLKGPVVPEGRQDLVQLVFDQLMAVGKANGVQYLVVQPPRDDEWMLPELARRDFHDGALELDYATVRVDLLPPLDALYAGLSKKCREHVRLAERRGVTVRQGCEADLPIFNRLKDLHSARLGYDRREEGYYQELWQAFAPRGHIELLIAEYQGEPVTAQLAIPFGDTYMHMERPWSGEHGKLKPNELLEWEVIKRAKTEGYRFVDHGAVPPAFAKAVASGGDPAADPRYSDSVFKLKFGGQLAFDPQAFDYIYNPALRFAYRHIPNRVTKSAWMETLVAKFKGTGT